MRRSSAALLAAALAALGARPARALNQGASLSISITVPDVWPPRAVSDLAVQPVYEGRAVLAFTAPFSDTARIPKPDAVSSYLIRQSTLPVSAFGGNADAWWSSATAVSGTVTPAVPGSSQTLTLSFLTPGVTFYFAVRSLDQASNLSALDASAASGTPRAVYFTPVPPGTPSGIAAALRSDRTVALSWTELTDAQKGADFAAYRVWRSSSPASPFAVVLTTPTAGALDASAQVGVPYRYYVTGIDALGLESPPSAVVSADLSVVPPLPPAGLSVTPGSSTVSVAWDAVTHYANGVPFANPAAPTLDELTGYLIYRATAPVGGSWVLRGATPAGQTSFTDAWDGLSYSYLVRAEHFLSTSAASVAISLQGAAQALSPDGLSYVDLGASARELGAAVSGVGDLVILSSANPSDVSGAVLASLTFTPVKTDGSVVPAFQFQGLVRVILHYQVQGGLVVPQGAVPQSVVLPAPQAGTGLGAFWFNGAKWVKVYGTVDTAAQTITVETHALGPYQIRVMERAQGASFDPVGGVSSRVITPNGDGLNDVVIFQVDNPTQSELTGQVFDLRGARVADLAAGPRADTLQWDGKSGGRVVPSGVYIYQLRVEDKVFNGTIVVAR